MKIKIEVSNQIVVVDNINERRMEPRVDIQDTVYTEWLNKVRLAESQNLCSSVIEVDEKGKGRLILTDLGYQNKQAKLDNEALAIRIANTRAENKSRR